MRLPLYVCVVAAIGCGKVVATQPDIDAGIDAPPVDVSNARTLTITRAGSGVGQVTSVPSGIDCGTTCSADFTAGTSIELSAMPTSGTSFTGWTGGGCSGTGTCTVQLAAATTVTATFACVAGAANFAFTGGVQMLVRPECVTTINVSANGAGGGRDNLLAIGGLGGFTSAVVTITATDVIYVFVGGAGGDAAVGVGGTGGYNGGGAGGTDGDQAGGGGGGATDIRKNNMALTDRIVIAGGGGGAAACGGTGFPGAVGGGMIGGNPPIACGTPAIAATGGSQIAGGVGGSYDGFCMATAGTLGIGSSGCSPSGGGGAGGGFFGGGGGAWMGGAGGSSFTAAGVTQLMLTQGVRAGNGDVAITW